jgi:hypothetical protein
MDPGCFRSAEGMSSKYGPLACLNFACPAPGEEQQAPPALYAHAVHLQVLSEVINDEMLDSTEAGLSSSSSSGSSPDIMATIALDSGDAGAWELALGIMYPCVPPVEVTMEKADQLQLMLLADKYNMPGLMGRYHAVLHSCITVRVAVYPLAGNMSACGLPS